MQIKNNKAMLIGGAAVGMMLSSGVALAVDYQFSGFIRQEMAYNLGGGNPANQGGNRFNNRDVTNDLGETFSRNGMDHDNDWNLMATRVELDMNVNIDQNWSAYVKMRGFFDNNIYKDQGDVNHFQQGVWGDCGSATEFCDDNYTIDFPSAYVDYTKGSLWLRIGNQQIAWGEAIFFRVLDVPNGLDLRRHLFTDWASEEYSDERVSSPAIRGSYRFGNDWEIEAFVQMFSPTLLPGTNSPYNVFDSQFILNHGDAFKSNGRGDVTTGIRLKKQIGELNLQFIAVNRRNPEGVWSWRASGVDGLGLGGAVGELFKGQPLEMGTEGEGVWTADEWMSTAANLYADGTDATASLLEEWPTAFALATAFGVPTGVGSDFDAAHLVVDSFSGMSRVLGLPDGITSLRAHVERKYPWENIFGFGANYMFFSDPGTLMDQLMVRVEATYTPDKQFTNIGLREKAIEHDEIAASLVFEKYHRFSESMPSTFMVLEWLFKSESDMFGRHLSGYGAGRFKKPSGRSDFNAVTFAMQQASPALMFRYDLAILYDIEGGYMIQPGIRFKPDNKWTLEVYANFFDGDRDDQMGTIAWSDEIGVRAGMQF